MDDTLPIPDSLPVIRRPKGLPLTCSDEEFQEAVYARLCGADDAAVAKLLHVPAKAVKYWVDSPEWGAAARAVTPEVEAILAGQLTRVANLALTQLDDRVAKGDPIWNTNGEPVLDESGKQRRKPLRGAELSAIALRVFEMKKTLANGMQALRDDADRIALDKLAHSLAELSRQSDEREKRKIVHGTAERVSPDPRIPRLHE